MKVSIITPSFNQGQFIEKTILSILCQDYPDIEYIVVDGFSTDSTQQVLATYKDYINHLIIEPDQGQTDALNKGFKLATGDVLAYLNSDDVYADPYVVSTAVRYLKEHPQVDVVYGQRKLIDEGGKLIRFDPYRPFNPDIFVWADFVPQECTFWTRKMFEKAGPYINSEFEFAMDYELFFRFLKQGAKFVALENVFGLFREHSAQKSIALWVNKGLPEISRLHEQYNGQRISEQEMMNLAHEHMTGTHRDRMYQETERYFVLWDIVGQLNKNVLQTPLDHWVYNRSIRRSTVSFS